MMFPFNIFLGFGTGFQPVAGFNWGAKRYDRVDSSYRFASRTATFGSLVMAGGLGIFAEPVIKLFAGEDLQMMEVGLLCLRLQCIALPVHAWVAVVNMLCTGLGNAKGAILLATSRQGTCMIPLIYPLAYLFGEYGIASVQAGADFLSLALAIPIAIAMTRKIKSALQTQLENAQQLTAV